MKKFFFIAAIASAALVSCTKNEVTPIAQDQEITFAAPVVGAQTKGAALTGTTFPEARDFKVYAEWFAGDYTADSGSAYIDGEVCTLKYGKDYWNPSKAYYWPTGSNAGSLTFIAYSPSTAPGSYSYVNGNGIVFTDYEVTTTVADQVDLLFSDKAYNKVYSATDEDHNANHKYNGVDLCFRHALCDINFFAKTKEDYSASTTITIKKIQMVNVAAKGTFDQGLADADGAVTNMDNQLWTASTDAADYKAYTVYEHATGETLDNVNAKPLATGGDLMLIPQTMGNITAEGTIKVIVSYDIHSAGTTIPTTQSIYLNTTGVGYPTQWLSGKRYNYTIIVGLNEIYFDPAVTDWVDVPVAPAI